MTKHLKKTLRYHQGIFYEHVLTTVREETVNRACVSSWRMHVFAYCVNDEGVNCECSETENMCVCSQERGNL